MVTISSINLNGIRAAARKGLDAWLDKQSPDIILMQEVRAPEDIVHSIMGEQWRTFVVPCRIKGRAGVAIAVRADREDLNIAQVRTHLDDAESDADSGRWIEADIDACGETCLTVVSAYFHSGEAGTPKQDQKMAHLPRIGARMEELYATSMVPGGRQALLAGDFNVVRSERDIKNWKSNHNKRSGVLDEEIDYLDRWIQQGWHDVVRDLAGDVQGPYTWWSQRGKAFDNDAGWRIDYHFATPVLKELAQSFTVGRAESYDTRFSDHAPLTVTYAL